MDVGTVVSYVAGPTGAVILSLIANQIYDSWKEKRKSLSVKKQAKNDKYRQEELVIAQKLLTSRHNASYFVVEAAWGYKEILTCVLIMILGAIQFSGGGPHKFDNPGGYISFGFGFLFLIIGIFLYNKGLNNIRRCLRIYRTLVVLEQNQNTSQTPLQAPTP